MASDEDDIIVDDAVAAFAELGVSETQVKSILGPLQRTLRMRSETIQLLRGESFCTAQEVLQGVWQPFVESHYTCTVRNWSQFQARIISANPGAAAAVVDVYRRTRDAAIEPALEASDSKNISTVNGVSPVRLCYFPNSASFVDGAHLCPKTAAGRKTDTWIYVAAAVLGMGRDTEDDRAKLVKALCGSCEPDSDVHQWTGINRSPFNLLLFANQRTWFDQKPGVIVLPVMTLTQARDWDGGSYEVLILCNASTRVATAAEMAVSILLTSTDEALVQHASPTDISSAVSLLSAVVKASAFCLENLPGPSDTKARQLWSEYQESLETARSVARTGREDGPSLDAHVLVPSVVSNIPVGKFVVKVDLAHNMTTPGLTPAYPDPMLLVYKSSVNWTRMFGFRLIAEAEAPNLPSAPPRRDIVGSNLSVRSEITQES